MLRKVIALVSIAAALFSSYWITHERTEAESKKDEDFIAGVFRPDGVIVPFARYANRKWTNPGQKSADAEANEPNTIADLPKPWYGSFVKSPAEWHISLRMGGTLTVQTLKNVRACSHCQEVWGLLTDYRDAKTPVKSECVSPFGIALSKRMKAPAMERLTNGATEWQQVLTFLRPEFERAEIAGLTEASQFFYSQIPAVDERAKIALAMQNLYTHPLDEEGRIILYFEVMREYPKPRNANDPSCNNISILEGWAVRDPYGHLTLLASQFSPTDCDMKGSGRTVPFALLQLDGKTFAVVEETSYEGESYVILEVRKDSIHRVLETYAGSC